jgi:hypothetical protein
MITKFVFSLLMIIQGLIHLPGFVKAFSEANLFKEAGNKKML